MGGAGEGTTGGAGEGTERGVVGGTGRLCNLDDLFSFPASFLWLGLPRLRREVEGLGAILMAAAGDSN